MSDEAVGPILNHAVSLLNTDIDGKKFSKMYDRPNPQGDSSQQQHVRQEDNCQGFRPAEERQFWSQQKSNEATAAYEHPD